MAEEPFVRCVGAAKRKRLELARRRFLFGSADEEHLVDDIEKAFTPTARYTELNHQLLQSRPEYGELTKEQRDLAKSTKIYRGERFALHWYDESEDESTRNGARLITIWAINKVDDLYGRKRPGIADIMFGSRN